MEGGRKDEDNWTNTSRIRSLMAADSLYANRSKEQKLEHKVEEHREREHCM